MLESTNPSRILWVDCIGGLVVGFVVLAFCQLISGWENLPLATVIVMGFANLVYGGYSLFVTTRKKRRLILIKILAMANMAWLLVCVTIAAMYWNQISLLGIVHVIGEGIYVAGLGFVEWNMKESLVTR